LNLQNTDWVIAVSKSGVGARPIKADWVREVKIQCVNLKIPFFFKQWGGINKKKTGKKPLGSKPTN